MTSHIVNNFFDNKDCLIPAEKQADLTTEEKVDKALLLLEVNTEQLKVIYNMLFNLSVPKGIIKSKEEN